MTRSAQAYEPAQNTGRFVARIAPPVGKRKPAYWFIFEGDELLVLSNDGAAEVPLAADLSHLESHRFANTTSATWRTGSYSRLTAMEQRLFLIPHCRTG